MVDPVSPDTPQRYTASELCPKCGVVRPCRVHVRDEDLPSAADVLGILKPEPVVAASVVSPPDPLDLDAIMTRTYPTVSAMRRDFEKLITEVERLRAALARPARPQEETDGLVVQLPSLVQHDRGVSTGDVRGIRGCHDVELPTFAPLIALVQQWRVAEATCRSLYESGDHAFSWYSQARMWRECADQLEAVLVTLGLHREENNDEDDHTRVDSPGNL